MKKVLLWIWQLPQNIAGWALVKILKAKKRLYLFHDYISADGVHWHQFKRKGWFSGYISGVSLGEYIILPFGEENAVKHEYGHCKQSKIFGWLYLLAVGIPSLVNNLWDRYAHKDWSKAERYKWYYSRYPENWADKLGGVNRG